MVEETERSRKALDRATEITKEMDASFRRFNVRAMNGDISEESLSQFEKEMKELDAEGKAVFANLRPTDRLS
jgi:chitinase